MGNIFKAFQKEKDLKSKSLFGVIELISSVLLQGISLLK